MRSIRILDQDGLDPAEVAETLKQCVNKLFVDTQIELVNLNVNLFLNANGSFYYKGFAVISAPSEEDFKEFDQLIREPEPSGRIMKI
jgi:hypothetical protein